MEFLKIKRKKSRGVYELYWCEARGKKDPRRSEKYLSKSGCYVITGDADSGKTRILKRLEAEGGAIWKNGAVYFSGVDPLAAWVHDSEGENQHAKIENLIRKIETDKPVVLFDDVHKLSGRKLQIAKRILLASRVYWMTSISHTRVPPTIRSLIDDKRVTYLNLKSEVAFDATIAAVLVFVVAGVAMGHAEIAIVGAIAGLLAGGRLSSSTAS